MKGYSSPVVSNGVATVDGTIVSIENIRLDELLGSGANGFVFAGKDLQLNRRVAVKVWPPRLDLSRPKNDPTKKALAEARKIARLKNDHIASIYHVNRLPNNGWVYAVMEYIEGEPLAKLRADLNDPSSFPRRPSIWHHVYFALEAAEAVGVYHGDLHGGNVIVTNVWGDVTLIDFGTSVLSGKGYSMRRHAKMVNDFAQWLLPELKEYIEPLDISTLAMPKYATWVVGQWVEAAEELQKLDADLSDISEEDLARRLTSLAKRYSTNLIDLNGPIAIWLANRGVSRKLLNVYTSEAEAELERRKRSQQSNSILKGLP